MSINDLRITSVLIFKYFLQLFKNKKQTIQSNHFIDIFMLINQYKTQKLKKKCVVQATILLNKKVSLGLGHHHRSQLQYLVQNYLSSVCNRNHVELEEHMVKAVIDLHIFSSLWGEHWGTNHLDLSVKEEEKRVLFFSISKQLNGEKVSSLLLLYL